MSLRPSRCWPYAHDAIDDIEDQNCSRGRGCINGARPGSTHYKEFGPGGLCGVLAEVALGDHEVEALDLVESRVVCHRYEERPEPPPRVHHPRPTPPGQLTIGEPDA